MVKPREKSMKVLTYISALVLSMVLALIPFAVIAVNDSTAVKAEITQAA
jgi:heme/copper-type cytochrome/quinol oxidase subunit 4